MYDRRLDAIVSAAELGSFSRAAAKLRISTPALVKQVAGFEAEHNLTLFTRSRTGVTATPAGLLLIDDARSIIRHAEDALQRARNADGTDGAVRMGISLMCPGRNTLELWPQVHELEPGLRLEIVPVGDLYDPRSTVMTRLGRQVDVIQTSYSTPLWGDACKLLHLLNVSYHIDVPRNNPLAGATNAELTDLAGMRIRILRHGNDQMDELREKFLAAGTIEVIDVDRFDFSLFNDAEEHGDAVLTSGAWSEVHPGFVGVPFSGFTGPCYLAYAQTPSPQVRRFVNALQRVLENS